MDSTAVTAAWIAALAAAASTVVAIVVGTFARRQASEARRQADEARLLREEQSRPYVIVDFEFRSILIYLVVKNIGATIARNVTLTFTPALETTLNRPREIDETPIFRTGIPMLAPGRNVSVLFDSFPDRAQAELPMTYTVTLGYEDSRGTSLHDPPYPLDLGMYYGAAIDPKGLPELVNEVSQLRKEAHKWTDGIRGLRVFVVDKRRQESREYRPYVRQQAAVVRRERGWKAYAAWHVSRLREKYGWQGINELDE